MYTQCPDCEIAFKVTADVLKQAAGKVRCGSCGNAFNALAYLSEQMPKQPLAKKVDAALPELTPEIIDTDDGLPQSISAEQSAALLKTLDELAGSDIRIEDTGVEWRVLDEQEAAAPAADDDDAGPDVDSSPDIVDEFLDDAATPIDEFLTATPEVVEAPEIFDEAANGLARTPVDELRFDDNTPLPDDFDLDDESSYAAKPDTELELDSEPVTDEAVISEPQPEIALSEPDEWTDILGEFQELVEEVATPADAVAAEEVEVDQEEDSSTEVVDTDEPLDMDSQFALQAEAMGIDLSGINELDEAEELELGDALNVEAELEDELDEETELEDELDEETELEDELDEETELEDELDEETELEDELEDELDEEVAQLDLIEDQEELIQEPVIESHTIESELAADASGVAPDDDSGEHFVPAMTEEEHTVNMQIDQDLMALAIEDEDGFASTIVIPEKDTEKKARDETTTSSDAEETEEEQDLAGFETIIMEGEHIRSALDSEKLAADTAAAAELAALARAKEAEEAAQSGSKRYQLVGGIVVLVLLLAVQVIHQSREALATIPAFSSTVGQIYRALGQPVQPAWDIAGWRIEASDDVIDVEEGEENLTVYSRIGNNSDRPMPYPLINISLTDRFLEPVGSQILDPAEYLPTDLDPRKLVEPGNTFNAVISIQSPSADASGYKVDVCYRLSDGRLRCAIDDFK